MRSGAFLPSCGWEDMRDAWTLPCRQKEEMVNMTAVQQKEMCDFGKGDWEDSAVQRRKQGLDKIAKRHPGNHGKGAARKCCVRELCPSYLRSALP